MRSAMWLFVVGLVAASNSASAQDILRGTISRLDVEKLEIAVTIDGQLREFGLAEETRVLDAPAGPLAERLKNFKVGSQIFLRPTTRDGKEVLEGIKLAEGTPGTLPPGGPGKGEIRSAKVKSIDVEKRTIVLSAEGKDTEYALTDATQIHGTSGGATFAERFAPFKAGDDIRYVSGKQDGQDVIVAMAPGGGQAPSQRIMSDTSALKPLDELGKGEYQGFQGGFYPDGANARPKAHEAAGLKLAAEVRPLDAEGKPAANGRVVLLSVGMSNTSQSSQGFQGALREAAELNPSFQFVNGAQGGMTAAAIQDPDDNGRGTQYWNEVDNRLRQAGVTRAQVQAVWIKQADAGPREGFPDYAKKLQGELARIVRVLHERFPNCKLCYLSSRTYGGYATTALNPEPYAYESGFAVKWLIEQQIEGDAELNYDAARGEVRAPWLSWGPYLWANGETKRAADGFSYEQADFVQDGTHQSPSGQRKVGGLMLEFFRTDSTTKTWFLK